jgi:hypothetical protein
MISGVDKTHALNDAGNTLLEFHVFSINNISARNKRHLGDQITAVIKKETLVSSYQFMPHCPESLKNHC